MDLVAKWAADGRMDELEKEVRAAGAYAKGRQASVRRSFKADGTVVTESDLAVTDRILAALRRIFVSGYNVLTEEVDLGDYDSSRPLTFVLDPIDGTDAYSQGLPSWCVALGMLDRDGRPVGAMISAPRFGVGEDELFLRADPGDGPVLLNGRPLAPCPHKDAIDEIMVGSKTFRQMDLSRYEGKIRSFGSCILHMAAPVLYSAIGGAFVPRCYVWDMAASHAVLLRMGMDVCYANGEPFVYDRDFTAGRGKLRMPLVVGSEAGRKALMALAGPRRAAPGSSS